MDGVVLTSHNGYRQELPFAVARRSGLVRMLADELLKERTASGGTLNSSSVPTLLEVPIVSEMRPIAPSTLALCVEYLLHFTNGIEPTTIPKPLPLDGVKFEDLLSEWEKSFITTKLLEQADAWQHHTLVDVMYAAQHLQLDSLRDLCGAWCSAQIAYYALHIKDPMESAECLRKFFGISNDWTEEELQCLQVENEWPADED
jgi:hypothetical protein